MSGQAKGLALHDRYTFGIEQFIRKILVRMDAAASKHAFTYRYGACREHVEHAVGRGAL
jgi:hypothetical protein